MGDDGTIPLPLPRTRVPEHDPGVSLLARVVLTQHSAFLAHPSAADSPTRCNRRTLVKVSVGCGENPIFFTFFRQLARYVWPHRWMALGLAFSMLIESGLDSATRFSFRYVIDEVVGPRSPSRLMLLFSLLGSAAVVITICCVVGDYLWAKLGTVVVNDLRTKLLVHVQSLSMDFFARRSSGDLLSCFMSDAESIENTLVTIVP